MEEIIKCNQDGWRKEFLIDILCSEEYWKAREKRGFPYND